MLWNGVISTKRARYSCFDVGDFYLETPLKEYEYMRMPLKLFPEWIIKQYNMKQNELDGFVYWEIRKAIHGLPQAVTLANKQLRENFKPEGYYEVAHTPGLFRHKRRPMQFTILGSTQ